MSAPGPAPLPTLLFLLAALPAAAGAETATLAGRVVPPAAAARARVEVWPACPPAGPAAATPAGNAAAAKPLAAVRPGPDGRFRIAAPAGEPVRLRIEAEGFVPAERQVEPGEADLPPLRLQRAEILELAFAGADALAPLTPPAPLAGLVLYLAPPAPAATAPERHGWTTPEQRVVTGPDGRAAVARRPGGLLNLVVASPRFVGWHQLGAGSPQKLALAAGRPVTLAVTDAAGRPAAGARVRLRGSEEIDELGRTGADGRLELRAPAGGPQLALTVEGGAGARTEVVLGASGAIGARGAIGASGASGASAEPVLAAVLRPPRAVAGRVIDAATRQPVAGARVEASCRAATRTAADGGFRLALGPRETEIAAWAPGYLRSGLSLRDPGAAGPFTLALQRTAALAVRAVDEAGAPVAGARILAASEALQDSPRPAALTGADGAARLAVRAGALYELSAERGGFAPARKMVRAPAAGAPPGAAMPPVVLVLTRGATLTGRLASEEDEPVAGGEVALQREADAGAFARPSEPRRAAAAPDGRFELRALLPGRHRLTVRAPGRAPAELPVEIPAGVRQVDLGTLALAAGAVLEGRVVDDRDRPVAGARIHPVGGPGQHPPAASGADGSFRVPDLERGQAELWVVREGYVQATFRGLAVPSPEPHVLRLRPARGISGRVAGPQGEPVAGAVVHRLRASDDDPERFTGSSSLAFSDLEGRFAAGGLEPGPLALLVVAAGYRSRQLKLEVPEERDAGPLEIALDAGAVVEGRVLAGGQPLAGALVHAYPSEPAGPTDDNHAATDGDGRYRLAGLALGRHEIAVAADGGRGAREQLEVRPGRQQLDFHLPTGELTGRVIDAAGAPVVQATLELAGPEGSGSSFGSSAADGSFAFRSVPPGAYRLDARHPEAGRAEIPEVAVAERPVALPDLVLEQPPEAAAVAGRLLGLELRDLARAKVQATFLPQTPDEQVDQPPSVFPPVNADGTFRLAGLVPGTWQIRAEAGDRRPVQQEVRLAAGEQAALELAFQRGARLTGRVAVDGQPAPGLPVRLAPDGGETRTRDDSSFALHDLRAGSYILEIGLDLLNRGLVWRRPVEIQPEVQADLELDVQVRTGAVAGRAHSPLGPLAGARVTVLRAIERGVITFQTGASVSQATTAEDGTFRFRLLPGRYRLRLEAGGAADVESDIETEVEVAAGAEVQVDMAAPAP